MTKRAPREAAERKARAALRAARAAAQPIEPDSWHTADGRTYGSISAARISEAARQILAAHNLAVELVSAQVVGNNYQTTWSWSWADEHSSWTSTPIRVDVPLAFERGEALPAAAAAITTGRKVFLVHLLELRQGEDREAELANAMESAKRAASGEVARAVAAYCRRLGISEDRAIRTLVGWAGPVEITTQQLPPFMVANLWARLVAHLPDLAVEQTSQEGQQT